MPLTLRSGPLHLLAFTPSHLKAHEAEAWSVQTRQRLLEQQLMLSRPFYAGRHHLKAVLGNPNTRSTDLAAVASVIQDSLLT